MKSVLFIIANVVTTALLCGSVRASEVSSGETFSIEGATVEVKDVRACAAPTEFFLAPSRLSCSTRDGIENFLKVTEITSEIVSVGAACTAVGAPVLVATGVTSVMTHFIDLVVSNLECEDPMDEQRVNAQIKRTVCDALNQKGIVCHAEQL